MPSFLCSEPLDEADEIFQVRHYANKLSGFLPQDEATQIFRVFSDLKSLDIGAFHFTTNNSLPGLYAQVRLRSIYPLIAWHSYCLSFPFFSSRFCCSSFSIRTSNTLPFVIWPECLSKNCDGGRFSPQGFYFSLPVFSYLGTEN